MNAERAHLTLSRRALPYLLFAVLVLIFLWKPIFTGKALLPGDYLSQMAPWKTVDRGPSTADRSSPQWNPLAWDAIAQFYPWRVFYARSMASGHIPLWNPHQFSGTPFLANGQSACLYPFNLLFLIFNPITAFTVFAALHLFLAQVFMYWLMRELGAKQLGGIVAAIVFAFSAFMVLWLELPTFVSVAVWLPLALMLVQRAVARRSTFYGMLSGLVLGLAFLAGHFQIAFYVVLATGLWWLWKLVAVWREEGLTYSFLKVGVPLIGCVLITGLISAPQILPTQELAANSHRVRQITEDGYQTFLDNALPTYRLVTAFAPWFYGDPSQGNYYLLGRVGDSRHFGSAADYMEYGMYAGILPLMLALIALGSIRKKHVGFFVLLTALALLTATGTPINRLFYFGIPGFSALGGPNRILLLYLFGIAALAGFGADWLAAQQEGIVAYSGRRMKTPQFVACAAVVAFCLLDATARALVLHIPKALAFYPQLVASAFLLVAAIVVLVRAKGSVGPGTFAGLAIALVIVDVFAFGINYNPTCDRSKVYPKTALTTELQKLTRNGERIAPINPKWSLFEVPKDAVLPPNAAMVYGLYDVQGYDSLYLKSYKDWSCRIQGEDSSPPENGNMVLLKRPVSGDVLETSKTVPGSAGRVFIDTSAAWPIEVLDNPHGDGDEGRRPAPDHTVEIVAPNRVLLTVSGEDELNSENVFLSYPGWDAKVKWATYEWDGSKGKLKPFDVTESIPFYSVVGPCGVVFEYEPFTFRLGLFLMLVGVGALSCVGVYRAQRYRINAKG